ncbi:MAG TPA: aspartate aminotransferase family protein [Actinomycetota bacterium]|nr:aspartate aminotransferase family protein [Actinomycetota bacterium]
MSQRVEIDPGRVEELIRREEAALVDKQPRSIEFYKRASQSLAGGVACGWHDSPPHVVYANYGKGSKLFDLDGNEFVDYYLGYGVMIVGHTHPKVVEAVRRRIGLGSHFAMPTEDAVAVAENLAERFGLPLWRFKNSGSESTLDAVRIMRTATGRDLVVKIEGCYHGSSDSLDFSVAPSPEDVGPPDRPAAVPQTAGIPARFGELLRIVPYNDLEAMERTLSAEAGRIAGVILEPIMLNIGVVPPEPGYLQGLRELTRRHGVLLAFDEVKTGATIAYGGAVEWSGVLPDVVALAKAIGGGVPCGAVGGTEEVMRVVVDGEFEQEGTFNGNPLTMASARATLTEVLTRDAYAHLEELRTSLAGGVEGVLERYRFPATVNAFGARGGIQHRAEPVRNYRDHLGVNERRIYLAWLYQANRGVLEPPWGDPWSISVQHSTDDIARYVENFEGFVAELTG